jgi:hypothetical protein
VGGLGPCATLPSLRASLPRRRPRDEKEAKIDWAWKPPAFPFEVTPLFPSSKGHVRYEKFKCPAFAGNPTHLEWWHLQVDKVGDKPTLGKTKWIELVSAIGITEDIVRELYRPEALTKGAY